MGLVEFEEGGVDEPTDDEAEPPPPPPPPLPVPPSDEDELLDEVEEIDVA